jgi:hypothetical protein
MLEAAEAHWLPAAMLFMIASFFRSNGFMLTGYIVWGMLVDPLLKRRKVRTYTCKPVETENSSRLRYFTLFTRFSSLMLPCVPSCYTKSMHIDSSALLLRMGLRHHGAHGLFLLSTATCKTSIGTSGSCATGPYRKRQTFCSLHRFWQSSSYFAPSISEIAQFPTSSRSHYSCLSPEPSQLRSEYPAQSQPSSLTRALYRTCCTHSPLASSCSLPHILKLHYAWLHHCLPRIGPQRGWSSSILVQGSGGLRGVWYGERFPSSSGRYFSLPRSS